MPPTATLLCYSSVGQESPPTWSERAQTPRAIATSQLRHPLPISSLSTSYRAVVRLPPTRHPLLTPSPPRRFPRGRFVAAWFLSGTLACVFVFVFVFVSYLFFWFCSCPKDASETCIRTNCTTPLQDKRDVWDGFNELSVRTGLDENT